MPKLIDPVLLADKNADLEGHLQLNEFTRLAGLLFEHEGEIAVDLSFFKSDGYPRIHGTICADLLLKCQRCLEQLEWPVKAAINLAIIRSPKQIDRLPAGSEPLLLIGQDKVLLKDIIEDELLLNLPDIPKHPGECGVSIYGCQQTSHEDRTHKASENSFSKLAILKKPEN